MKKPTPSHFERSISDVGGISVGHYTNLEYGTGATVILTENPGVGGIEVRGAAPGSRETELLYPLSAAQHVNGFLLTGGSSFGLDAAGGVVKYLEETGVGLNVGRVYIPLIPSAVIFDLSFISSKVRPAFDDGYKAAQSASKIFQRGSVGVGTGCTVAKILGMKRSVKGGVGTSSVKIADGTTVGAIIAVNAIGDVVDPKSGNIVAGPLLENKMGFHNSSEMLISQSIPYRDFFRNTVIGVIATDAKLNKIQTTRLAMAAQDGITLAIRPAHMQSDGDIIFALATGEHLPDSPPNINSLHAACSKAVTGAILDAMKSATSLGGIAAINDLPFVETGFENE